MANASSVNALASAAAPEVKTMVNVLLKKLRMKATRVTPPATG